MTARQLEELGIADEAALRAINANCLCSLEGALIGRDWRNLPAETITRLRAEAGLPPKKAKAYSARKQY